MNAQTIVTARINHVALQQPDETIDEAALRDRAHTELLRQRAVSLGYLKDHGLEAFVEIDDDAQTAIEEMLAHEVPSAQADDQEAQRYYEASRQHYVVGQAVWARHILFAVTTGINVQLLANQAETVLLGLQGKGDDPAAFIEAAKKYSNCPSGQNGGDLGWLQAEDCAPELSKVLFKDSGGMLPRGLHPRLIHSRYGLHIMEILESKPGRQLTFDEVQSQVIRTLEQRSHATALRQYMMLLVGDAEVTGIALEGANSPLVQG